MAANNNQLFTGYNYAKLFLFGQRFTTKQYINTTGGIVTLAMGTLMGTLIANNSVVPCVSTATDGSEQPTGVLQSDYTVPIGATITVSICIGGDVAKDLVILGGSDTWATPVLTYNTGGGTLEDMVVRNTHIYLVPSFEDTINDNGIS